MALHERTRRGRPRRAGDLLGGAVRQGTRAGPGGSGYSSAHYLLSWYYAWGGPITPQGWAFRIGSSHNHFEYQNPVAAYALSVTPELRPASANGARDWGQSLTRQLEFYRWLQSAEGAIAGGATNSLNGRYDPYPVGTPTFYGMAYQEHPVYHDPGSNTWFGFQAWSMERVAECRGGLCHHYGQPLQFRLHRVIIGDGYAGTATVPESSADYLELRERWRRRFLLHHLR